MLFWLGENASEVYGPMRLLTSYLFLYGVGTALAATLTLILVPKLWTRLPADQGRQFAVDAEKSQGKPVGAGVIFVPIFIGVCLLVTPFDPRIVATLACVFLVMLAGYVDDRAGGLSEYFLGLVDLVIGVFGAMAVCGLEPYHLWLPFVYLRNR